MKNIRLSRVILFVNDMPKMTDFYSKVLGLPLIDDSDPGFIILDAFGSELCLHQIPKKFADSNSEAIEDSKTKIVFHSDNVETVRNELLSKYIRMKKTIVWKDLVFCDGFDPEGNIFQISNR